ncbi:hypothetical protein HYZ97_00895 [Candidatus Pacearchaeota archaeon]|nr:hypothetical protein [Candidatus Pacearchaeota archaeon]
MNTPGRLLLVSLLIISVLALGFLAGRFFSQGSVTGEVIATNEYMWTTAICQNTRCLDVLITCVNGEVTSIEPVSDFKEFNESWQDPRANLSRYCA